MEDLVKQKLQSDVFERLLAHLQSHTEVQNIDLMNLADFCRNCLSKWFLAAAENNQVTMTYDQALEHIYGMPYATWKSKFQKEATPEQLALMQSKKQS